MNEFRFELGEQVEIQASGEFGTVIGRAEFDHSDNSYLIRYKNGNGNAVENWWTEIALVTR